MAVRRWAAGHINQDSTLKVWNLTRVGTLTFKDHQFSLAVR